MLKSSSCVFIDNQLVSRIQGQSLTSSTKLSFLTICDFKHVYGMISASLKSLLHSVENSINVEKSKRT